MGSWSFGPCWASAISLLDKCSPLGPNSEPQKLQASLQSPQQVRAPLSQTLWPAWAPLLQPQDPASQDHPQNFGVLITEPETSCFLGGSPLLLKKVESSQMTRMHKQSQRAQVWSPPAALTLSAPQDQPQPALAAIPPSTLLKVSGPVLLNPPSACCLEKPPKEALRSSCTPLSSPRAHLFLCSSPGGGTLNTL